MVPQDKRRAKAAPDGKSPPRVVDRLRHSRIAMTGAALAAFSVIWFFLVHRFMEKTSSSSIGAALSTMVIGGWPAIAIWSIGLACSIVGLVLALRRRARFAMPIIAMSLCAAIFVWANWPTPGDLVDAARKGDTARASRYLWLGADIDRPRRVSGGLGPPGFSKEEQTPLTAAVLYSRTEMVEFLLDEGTDINKADGDGHTPVVTAVRGGRADMIELLIARGAALSLEDPEVSKSLFVELRSSRWPVDQPERLSRTVEVLIRHGANLEPVEIHDLAMEHWAPSIAVQLAQARQERGHPVNPPTDLRNLIALGDDDRAVAMLRETPDLLTADETQGERYRLIGHAARFDCPQVMVLLRDHLPPLIPETGQEPAWSYGATLLRKAAAAGNLEIVGMLLDWGMPVDCRTSPPALWTPLSAAVVGGHIDVASLLIERGADVNFNSSPGRRSETYIFHAAEQGDMSMVTLLLKAGAKVDVYGHNRDTPADHAANAGHAEVAKLLLDHGSSLNQLSPQGYETLYQAGLEWQNISDLTKRPPQ